VLFPVTVGIAGLAATVAFGTAGIVLALLIGITWAGIAVIGTAIVTNSRRRASGEVLGAYVALGALGGALGGVLGGWTATLGYTVAWPSASQADSSSSVRPCRRLSLEALSGGGRAVTTPPPEPEGVETVGDEVATRAANRDE